MASGEIYLVNVKSLFFQDVASFAWTTTYEMGAWDALGAMIKGAIPVTKVDGNPIYYDQKNADGSPIFTDGPDGGKAMVIQKILGKYRQAAKKMLEGGDPFPEVQAEYVAKQTRKKMNQVPQIAGGAR